MLSPLFRDLAWKDAPVTVGRIKESIVIKGSAKSGDNRRFFFDFTVEGKSYSGYQTEDIGWYKEKELEPGKSAKIQYNKSWPLLSRVIGK